MTGTRRILVADGNTKFLEKTREILDSVKLAMIACDNGGAVLGLARSEQPQAVLLNADLPDLSGNEVCRRLKAEDPSLPVVMMFGDDHPGLAGVAERAGADNFLIRPLKRTELLFCMRSLLALRPMLAAHAGAGAAATGPRGVGLVSIELYQRFLELELRRVSRYGFPLSLLAIAIDPLPPTVSATWADTLRRQLFAALSSTVRACMRDIDLLCIAADEMLVLMPHTDLAGGRTVGERIRQTVGAQPYHFGRLEIQPTVSLGLLGIHGERLSAEEALARLVSRRQQAATGGGNRLVG